MTMGTFGEWISGLGTLAAVVTTIVLTRSERTRSQKNLEDEREHSDRVLMEERERSDMVLAEERELTRQALQLERDRWEADLQEREQWQANLVTAVLVDRQPDGRRPTLCVSLANASPSPIADVQGFYVHGGVTQRGDPADAEVFWTAGAQSNFWIATNTKDAVHNVSERQCGVTFRDASGVRWARYLSGHLLRLGPNPDEELKSAPWVG